MSRRRGFYLCWIHKVCLKFAVCGFFNKRFSGKLYISWLMIVTVAYTYNSWVLPLRCCFPYQTESNLKAWMYADYTMDFIYLMDLVVVKSRVMYLSDGFWIQEYKLTSDMYFKKCQCKVIFVLYHRIFTVLLVKMDVLSLLPLDLLCLIYGWERLPFFRLPRLLKVRCERIMKKSNYKNILDPNFLGILQPLWQTCLISVRSTCCPNLNVHALSHSFECVRLLLVFCMGRLGTQ